MRKKKAEISMETVVIAIIVLCVLAVLFVILTTYMAKTGKSFNDIFKKNVADSSESLEGQEVSLPEGENKPISLANGEKLGVEGSVTGGILTVTVKDSSGNEINCNYNNAWTFSKGEIKCCENAESQLCMQYNGVKTSSEGIEEPQITYITKAEWLTTKGTMIDNYKLCVRKTTTCNNSIYFWTGEGKYLVELKDVTDGILAKHAHFNTFSYTLHASNSMIPALCVNHEGDDFAVESHGTGDCAGKFRIKLNEVSEESAGDILTNSYARITILESTQTASETAGTSDTALPGTGSGTGEKKSVV